jgi:hypothetical protein
MKPTRSLRFNTDDVAAIVHRALADVVATKASVEALIAQPPDAVQMTVAQAKDCVAHADALMFLHNLFNCKEFADLTTGGDGGGGGGGGGRVGKQCCWQPVNDVACIAQRVVTAVGAGSNRASNKPDASSLFAGAAAAGAGAGAAAVGGDAETDVHLSEMALLSDLSTLRNYKDLPVVTSLRSLGEQLLASCGYNISDKKRKKTAGGSSGHGGGRRAGGKRRQSIGGGAGASAGAGAGAAEMQTLCGVDPTDVDEYERFFYPTLVSAANGQAILSAYNCPVCCAEVKEYNAGGEIACEECSCWYHLR